MVSESCDIQLGNQVCHRSAIKGLGKTSGNKTYQPKAASDVDKKRLRLSV